MHFCSQSSRYAKQGLLKVLFSHVISLPNPRDLTYLCSNVLHSNEHKLSTIITSTCFSERSANLPTFIKTYIYIVLYFTSLCNKEKYTLIIQTEVKHRFLCTVLLQSVLSTCHKTWVGWARIVFQMRQRMAEWNLFLNISAKYRHVFV